MLMKKHIHKSKWLVLFITSLLVLIWRLVDFTYEAAYEGFHMTRGGLALSGLEAEVIQLAIILGVATLAWKTRASLVRLHSTNSTS